MERALQTITLCYGRLAPNCDAAQFNAGTLPTRSDINMFRNESKVVFSTCKDEGRCLKPAAKTISEAVKVWEDEGSVKKSRHTPSRTRDSGDSM